MDSNAADKPVLVYDGECGFCRLWIDRWKDITAERIRYASYQNVASQFPQIPLEDFSRAVQLILPDGTYFSAAHAVYRSLAVVPGYTWLLWLYQHLPGFAPVSESLYRFVARHRNPLYRLTRIFWGKRFDRPSLRNSGR